MIGNRVQPISVVLISEGRVWREVGREINLAKRNIDKSIQASNGKIAVCFIDGDFTVKKIKLENKKCWLMPANDKYQPIEINEQNDLQIWGIVIHVIKSF